MHTIKHTLVPHAEYRKPTLMYETRPDPEDGRSIQAAVVNVPLSNAQVAQIDLEDYNLLMEKGFSDQWWAHSNGGKHAYVRTSRLDAPGKLFTVARLIAGGQWGTRVRYRNGNPLDLRQSNLKVREGFSKGHEAAALADNPGDEGEF